MLLHDLPSCSDDLSSLEVLVAGFDVCAIVSELLGICSCRGVSLETA